MATKTTPAKKTVKPAAKKVATKKVTIKKTIVKKEVVKEPTRSTGSSGCNTTITLDSVRNQYR